jgi:EAL domain-containing protein (putative c-di-GMP-specific phosphodiesterase class I)
MGKARGDGPPPQMSVQPLSAPVLTEPASADWATLLAGVVAEPTTVNSAYQPIVDLGRGQATGYELLSRFPTTSLSDGPEAWFAAARKHGVAAEIESEILRRALNSLADLPDNTFLSVNVSPEVAMSPLLAAVAAEYESLDHLVVEITEHESVADYGGLARVLEPLRERGAQVAVDDVGAGYASMRHVMEMRPDFVKIDRGLVANLDRDPAKLAIIESLASFASRIDAGVIAEGVERLEEVDTLVRLGIPLAQGFVFARPDPTLVEVPTMLADYVRDKANTRGRGLTVEALVERTPSAPLISSRTELIARLTADSQVDAVPLLDGRGRAVGIATRGMIQSEMTPQKPLMIGLNSSLGEVARRAMTRAAEERFTPLICCDDNGRYVGIVRVERLVEALATSGEL